MENAHVAELQKKALFVKRWLKSLKVPEDQCQFETNEQSLTVLYKLAKTCEERDKENALLKQDYQTKMKEYQSESSRLQTIWNEIGENQSLQLSSNAQTLSELAVSLELKDTANSSYMMAINDLQDDLDNVQAERAAIQTQSKQFAKQALATTNRFKVLQKYV